VARHETEAEPPQEPDTRRREIDAAGNPEGAQGREAARSCRAFSSHRSALTPGQASSLVSATSQPDMQNSLDSRV
jgi:hypothetical protein